jgi:DNA replication protein DnaC
MTAGALMELGANLKALNLSTMARNLESPLRQARETGMGYDEFLLELTRTELQVRSENRLTRRIREAKFPLLKPMETFDLAAVPELDIRLFRDFG